MEQRRPNQKVRDIAMKRRCNSKNRIRLAGLACILLIPAFAQADTCLNLRPSFTYAPVVSAGAQSTLRVSAQAGCFWELLSQPEWIKIVSANRGYGSGSVAFQVQPNQTGASSPGFLRLVVRDLNSRRSTTLDLPIRTIGNPDGSAARTVVSRR
jgi:hypothetical protein